jgi:hypothetical protein
MEQSPPLKANIFYSASLTNLPTLWNRNLIIVSQEPAIGSNPEADKSSLVHIIFFSKSF